MRRVPPRLRLLPSVPLVLAVVSPPLLVPGAFAAAETDLSARKLREAIAYCETGDDALRHGELSSASEQFEKALAIVPEFPEAYMGLGHIALVRRDYAAAVGSYTRARDAYEHIGEKIFDYRLRQKGKSQQEILNRRDDIMNLTKLLQGGPELEHRVREIEREIDYFDRMEYGRPDKRAEVPATVFFFRGNALFHLDRLDEAVADWEEAVERAPDFGPVYNNLALAYWKLGRKQQAQEALAQAEKLGVTVHPGFKQLVLAP